MSINYSEIKCLTEAKHDVGNDEVNLLLFSMILRRLKSFRWSFFDVKVESIIFGFIFLLPQKKKNNSRLDSEKWRWPERKAMKKLLFSRNQKHKLFVLAQKTQSHRSLFDFGRRSIWCIQDKIESNDRQVDGLMHIGKEAESRKKT